MMTLPYFALIVFFLVPLDINDPRPTLGAVHDDSAYIEMGECMTVVNSMRTVLVMTGKKDRILAWGCKTKPGWLKTLGFDPWLKKSDIGVEK